MSETSAHTNRWNTLSIVALVTSVFVGPVGVICGIIALFHIRSTRERGLVLAILAIVLGIASVTAYTFGHGFLGWGQWWN